jgi:hypothetical protein
MKTISPTATHQPELKNGPPENVEASELVAMLTTLPRPNKIIPYPRKLPGSAQPIAYLGIVAAMIQDKINAQAAAHAYARQILADPDKANKEGKTRLSADEVSTLGYDGVFRNACAIELLYRSCVSAKRKPGLKGAADLNASDYEVLLPITPAFPGARWMRLNCTDDEIGVLTASYLRAQMEIGPIVSMLSDAEADLWIEKLIAGGVAGDPFDSLASDAKTDLVMRLVYHLRNSRKANTSSGGQLENGSTESEQESDRQQSEASADASDGPVQVEYDQPPVMESLPVEPKNPDDDVKAKWP